MESVGIEPTTTALLELYSNQLNYDSNVGRKSCISQTTPAIFNIRTPAAQLLQDKNVTLKQHLVKFIFGYGF